MMKTQNTFKLLVIVLLALIVPATKSLAQICPPNVIIENDTSVCENYTMTLHVNALLLPGPLLAPGKTPAIQGTLVTWSTGDTTYSITVSPIQTTTYYVTVSSGIGICYDSITITVAPPATNLNYTTTVICGGLPVDLYAPPATSHQWYRNNVAINGATGLLYSATLGGSYYCELINSCGRYNTVTLPLTYSALPTLSVSSSAGTYLCSGASTNLSSTTNAINPTYQWLKNNVNIPGATLPTLNVNAGGTYRLKVTNNLTGCVRTSSGLSVKKSTLSAAFTADPCNAGAVVMNATTNGILPQFQWLRNNVILPGANSNQYITNKNGFFKVTVVDSFGCSKTSTGLQVYMNCRTGEFDQEAGIQAYPNPAHDMLYLNAGENNPKEIRIYNLLGSLVLTTTWMENLSLLSLQSGIYFLEVLDQNNNIMTRMRFQKVE